MNTLRLPISFNFDGTMQSIVDGSDEYYATIIGNSIQIEKGDLPLSQLYGIDDPVFSGKSVQRLMREVASYVPEVTVTDVGVQRADTEGNVDVKIQFRRNQ
jgi:hypothetical protein